MKVKGLLIFVSLWLLMIAVSYHQQVEADKRHGQKIAYRQAEMLVRYIVLVQQWNVQHGRVYVPVTDKNPPNEYLTLPDRDVTTLDGKQLTLIDPAYMMHQMAEMVQNQTGILFHITSLEPIRPENKADEWEIKALEAIKQGQSSFQQLAEIDGQPFYRYMAPLLLEPGCMTCHGGPGAQVGDLRGGISVSIPAASIDDFMRERLEHLKKSHIFIAIIGVIALTVAYWARSKLNRRLIKAKNRLKLAYLDALTSLPNRRYYDTFIYREWQRASRHRYPLSMIMIDIDYFKAYNDSLGHMEGDQCLRRVARTLRRYFRRSGDLIARYGGEEFCVVAACDSTQIMQLAEILRMAVEMMQIPHPNSPISKYVTISLGVATMVANEKVEFRELLHRADQALYAAKQAGRNRVIKYQG